MTVHGQLQYINSKLDYLKESRPTAVDLSNAIKLLKLHVNVAAYADTNGDSTYSGEQGHPKDASSLRTAYIKAAEKILEDDLSTNLAIGRYGAEYLRRQQMPVLDPIEPEDDMRYFTTSPPGTQGLPDQTYRKVSVLTHCNTGYVKPFKTGVTTLKRESNFKNGGNSAKPKPQIPRNIRTWHCSRYNPQPPPNELPRPRLLHRNASLQPRLSTYCFRAGV